VFSVRDNGKVWVFSFRTGTGPLPPAPAKKWYGDLAANAGQATAFANAKHLDAGEAVFSLRDNGQVWVFSFWLPGS
jgi:hypothetical protein